MIPGEHFKQEQRVVNCNSEPPNICSVLRVPHELGTLLTRGRLNDQQINNLRYDVKMSLLHVH